MNIQYEVTHDDYLEFNLHYIKSSQTMRKTLFFQRIIGPITFVFGPFVAIKITDIPIWYWIIAFSVTSLVWFFYYPKYIVSSLKRRVNRTLKEGQNKGLIGKQTLTITEDGLEFKNDFESASLKWSVLNKIERNDQYLFIYNSSVSAYIIPLSEMTKETGQELYEIVEQHIINTKGAR